MQYVSPAAARFVDRRGRARAAGGAAGIRRFTPDAPRSRRALDLSPREFAILGCLIGSRGEVVTREHLLSQVWGYRRPPFTRTVDMHIAKLRRKIEPSAGAPERIVTVHGVGYKFVG